jgi:hypothetical protein
VIIVLHQHLNKTGDTTQFAEHGCIPLDTVTQNETLVDHAFHESYFSTAGDHFHLGAGTRLNKPLVHVCILFCFWHDKYLVEYYTYRKWRPCLLLGGLNQLIARGVEGGIAHGKVETDW